ncbi:hypothetical protein BBJ28_00016880 [Nothophytophthora sp. Chile5]|nr:hypothetical protein BBJ28_00016880 [Nothophytophthora sp. Chile5]
MGVCILTKINITPRVLPCWLASCSPFDARHVLCLAVSTWHQRKSIAPALDVSASSATRSMDKVKVVMLGEAAVGKTALFSRLMGTALPSDYAPSTTGPRIYARYFGGAQALVLVFSLSAPESWRGLPKYLEVARREILGDEATREPQEAQQTLPVVVVGSKSDCLLKKDENGEAEAERASTWEEARAWCRENGLAYVEVSALGNSTTTLDIFKLTLQQLTPAL